MMQDADQHPLVGHRWPGPEKPRRIVQHILVAMAADIAVLFDVDSAQTGTIECNKSNVPTVGGSEQLKTLKIDLRYRIEILHESAEITFVAIVCCRQIVA